MTQRSIRWLLVTRVFSFPGCPPVALQRSQRYGVPWVWHVASRGTGERMTNAFNTAVILAVFAVMALRPPVPRHSTAFNLQFALGWWINEAPFLGLWWLIAGTIDTLLRPEQSWWWWLVAVLTGADVLLLGWITVRARWARPALSEALQIAYGPNAGLRPTSPAWWRILLPVISWRPDVRRIRNVRYGPAPRGNRLDVYVSRRGRTPRPAPAFVYFHGGFAFGSKILGSRALIYRLAAQGWVCVSASRRLFGAGYSEQLADVKAALAWVRGNAGARGADPDRIFAAGGSAGAHLAATAALTNSEVVGVVSMYGYYGKVGAGPGPTSPQEVINPDAPSFFIIHGTLDTLVPHQEARSFADRLRAVSRRPVVYAELPGAQHNFDFFQSIRAHAITDAVRRFAELA